MHEGTVAGVDPGRGRIVVLTDWGYTYAELLDGEARMGDVLEGNLDDHGDQRWRNRSRGCVLEVYVQGIQADAATATRWFGA